jgi:hypothetical protein
MRDDGTLRRAPIVAERSGINLYAEHSLHAQLKEYLAGPGDRLEVPMGGRVIDLVRADGELVEVQTGNLGKIVAKTLALAGSGHRVRVVHPIAAEREIRRLDPKTAELLSVRKSPRRGDVFTLFDELVMAAGLVASRNVTVEALLIKTVEVKTRDGSGSWWRRGDRTVDRELLEVLSSRSFRTPGQWLSVIPGDLLPPWTSSSLGEALEIGPDRARKILYCLARAGLLIEVDKDGRRKAYEASKARRKRPSP